VTGWHHVVAQRSGDNFEIYVDGVLAGSGTTAVGTVTSSEPLLIGGTGTDDYEGLLDDVRGYARALDTADIAALRALGPTDNQLTVDTTSDTVDGTTTDVAALLANRGADGFISLREAILAVNNDPATTWTITMGAGTYTFNSGTGDSAGDFDIRNDVTISGAGIGSTIIDGNDRDRLFQVFGSNVTIERTSTMVH